MRLPRLNIWEWDFDTIGPRHQWKPWLAIVIFFKCWFENYSEHRFQGLILYEKYFLANRNTAEYSTFFFSENWTLLGHDYPALQPDLLET